MKSIINIMIKTYLVSIDLAKDLALNQKKLVTN